MFFHVRPWSGSIFCFALLFAGCAGSRVALEDHPAGVDREILVREIEYDEKGIPVIGAVLDERPSRPGDRFTVLRMSGSRPVVSYDISIFRQRPDFGKPFQVVYEWTGRGFKAGAEASAVFAGALRSGAYSGEEAVAALAFVVTPMAAGTVGGFVVGIVDGIRHTALELGKVVINAGEQVVTCTTYHHDSRGRLTLMRMLTPDRVQELVRTEFVYEGSGTRPVRTVVRSLPEGRERDVR